MSVSSFFHLCFIAFFLCFFSLPLSTDSASEREFNLPLALVDEEVTHLGGSEAPNDSLSQRFSKNVLVNNLNEPTEFELLEDGKILFTQRRGTLMLFDPQLDELIEVASLDVHTKFEDGLMGLALDPNYTQNNWIYLYYSPASTNPDAQNEDYVPTEEESKQHLSRFVYKDGVLDMDSEILMLEVYTQRVECCHTGGSIEFGPDGNLFLSTGDDVNPFASDGFGPFDEQEGRSPWDGQTTSANTNDLRGKILRIKPQPDGTYTIPEGNLFPVGTDKTRPEIYVMGNRNPYRISIDQKTGFLYWGEVGPDAREDDKKRGPRGHDEINQARQAGNFGWPLFVADNKAYVDYDFAKKKSGLPFDPSAPINDSPNNTGLQELPPAQKAFIWYPYAESPEFPVLGAGGRNAMAGPVFYKDAYETGPHSFPAMYDGKLFIYDWIRGWIMTVTMDENSDLVRIDPFMEGVAFHNPIDMQFDKEGVLYVMEYGKTWFSQNQDARISRIEYNSGDMPAENISSKADVGNSDNSPPHVEIVLEGNRSFFFGNETRSYEVVVSDAEDGSLEGGQIDAGEVRVQLDYLPEGQDKTLIAQGHQMADESSLSLQRGKKAIENSDCAACHALDRLSIGPSYKQVAEKYAEAPDAKEYLMDKIKNGGSGVWGERVMAAHPQLSTDEITSIVEYILSAAGENSEDDGKLGVSGVFSLDQHEKGQGDEGMYFIRAAYTDKGDNPETSEANLTLRHPRVQAETMEISESISTENNGVLLYKGSYLGVEDVDMTGISKLSFFVKRGDKESAGGIIEARLASPDGIVIGELQIDYDSLDASGKAMDMPIEATDKMQDVYFVLKNDDNTDVNLFVLDWVMFAE